MRINKGIVSATLGMQNMQNDLNLKGFYLQILTAAQTWCCITLSLGII